MFFKKKIPNERALSKLSSLGLTTEGKHWWVKYPERAVKEIHMMANGTNAFMRYEQSKLIFDEELTNDFGSKFVISIETKGYPFKMPEVILKSPKIKPKGDLHLFRNGSICYIDSSEYNSNSSILQVRNQAAAWCFCVEASLNTGKWPGAEH